MKKNILIIEPGFEVYKEPIVKAMHVSGLAHLHFASGIKGDMAEWVNAYGPLFHFSYSKNDLLEKVLEYQKQHGITIDGVMTYIDTSVHFVNRLQHALRLPIISHFTGKEIRSKAKMRALFGLAWIPQPQIGLVKDSCDQEKLFRQAIPFPLIVKPAEMMSSLAVRKVNTETELRSAIAAAATADFEGENLRDVYGDISNEVLVEQFIGGQEYSVETVVVKGKPQILGVTKKQTTAETFFDELGHQFPAPDISQEVLEKIDSLVIKTHSALKLVNSCTHLEVKIFENEPYVIELNCRLGGDLISELIRKAKYPNLGQILVNVCLGQEVSNATYANVQTHAIRFFSNASDGIVRHISLSQPSISSAETVLFVKEREIVSPGRDSSVTRLGYLIGPSGVVDRDFLSISERIKVEKILAQSETPESRKILVVTAQPEDIDELVRVETLAWHGDQAAPREMILKRLSARKDTIIKAIDAETGLIYGFLTSGIAKGFGSTPIKPWEKYSEILQNYDSRDEHFGVDDALFLVSASVDPLAPKGMGSLLLKAAVEVGISNGLETICYGGRITAMKDRVTAGQSPEEVYRDLLNGQIIEPSIQMGFNAGFEPAKLVPQYFDDPSSLNFGILMVYRGSEAITKMALTIDEQLLVEALK